MDQHDQYRSWCAEIADGNEHAFNSFYREFSPVIYRVAMRYANRDSVTTEELVQLTFIRIWEKREALRGARDLESFIFVLSKNVILDFLRQRSRELVNFTKFSSEVLSNTEKITGIQEEKEYTELLQKAVAQLPPQQQKVYRLSKDQGLSQEEIARKISLSRLTVETHLKLANRSLRRILTHIISIWVFFTMI